MKLLTEKCGFHTYQYEVVDEIPLGYSIWAIGQGAPKGYLPLCRLSRDQPFSGGRNVEADTLKAIKVDGAEIILAAIGNGVSTLAGMLQYVEEHQISTDPYVQTCVERFQKAIPIMQKIKGVHYLVR